MAGDAAAVQDRSDVAVEINGLRSRAVRVNALPDNSTSNGHRCRENSQHDQQRSFGL
jgi:hypothetical protein